MTRPALIAITLMIPNLAFARGHGGHGGLGGGHSGGHFGGGSIHVHEEHGPFDGRHGGGSERWYPPRPVVVPAIHAEPIRVGTPW
jgi:hypothetical protein